MASMLATTLFADVWSAIGRTLRGKSDPQVVRRIENERRLATVVSQVWSLRRNQKMTQSQLARRVETTQASVSRFESGKMQHVGYLYVKRMLEALRAL
jgi:predicted XRE-type DNA-binding protein